MKYNIQAVVIGVSAGGFQALHTLLPLFPEDFSPPIIIVQHRMTGSDNFFIESLRRCCSLNVIEPDDKEIIQSGTVYIAPSGYHLLIEKDFSLSLSVDEPVSFARPSINVLFESAAEVYGAKLAGIILTGANSDGSDGIKMVKKNGGLTIVQAPDTAEFDIMPLSAISTNSVDFILSLEEILPFLVGLQEDRDV